MGNLAPPLLKISEILVAAISLEDPEGEELELGLDWENEIKSLELGIPNTKLGMGNTSIHYTALYS